jgi:hypothetical protein
MVRLLVVVGALTAAGGHAATALAVPPTPKLVLTSPPSSEGASAGSTTPAVLGEAEPEDGIILEWAPLFDAATFGPVSRTAGTDHPQYEVRIFGAAECQGAVVAAGSAQALETTGIAVSVPVDAKSAFSAIQIDPAEPGEPSGCSNALFYWEGNVPSDQGTGGGQDGDGGGTNGSSSGGASTGGSIGGNAAAGAPDAPRLRMVPGERANDVTPLVAGSAHGAEKVTVYASANCSGSPVAKGTPAQLSSGFQVSVPVNAVTSFSAVAIAAQHSGCSDPVTYTEDSTAPRTRITMGPGVKTRKRKAVFRFKDVTEDPPGTTFKCKVDRKKWRPCSSPFHLKHLKLGRYVLSIRATDVAGNLERRPVKRRFMVVPPARR